MPAIENPPCNVDECANATDVCTGENMHCVDTIGTYVCVCDPGWVWNPEKFLPTTENPQGRVPTPDNNFWVYDVGSADPPQVCSFEFDKKVTCTLGLIERF